MNQNILKWVAATALSAIALILVFRIYASGNIVLASICLAGCALALYVYTSTRASTYRYLFPGLAGISIFVVLPLVYTIWISFTEYASKNLLTFARATDTLLSETYQKEGGQRYGFTLHPNGDQYRIVLTPIVEEEEGSIFDDADSDESEDGEDDDGGSIFDDEGEDDGGSIFDDPEPGDADSIFAEDEADSDGDAASDTDNDGANDANDGAGAARLITDPFTLPSGQDPMEVSAQPIAQVAGFDDGNPLVLRDIIERQELLNLVSIRLPDGAEIVMSDLRHYAPEFPLYAQGDDGSLANQKTGEVLTPNFDSGFYENQDGESISPGFRVVVGFEHYLRIFTDEKLQGPFIQIFIWTVVFAGLTVLFSLVVGLILAELLAWEALRFRGVYRLLLFLPYAVPGFISILVFKGLFNSNFGEINLILSTLFGIKPNWFEDPFLAKVMILIVNTWLGYPYIMLLCMGLQKSIANDLYEASALAGAGPFTNFFRITWPLIRKPLTPLLISSFAFNFNNFVLIYLLTNGRPDFIDTTVQAGTTDILVSYTYRIAFQDSGQNFGLAAAISTVIFILVAILSIVNLRLTKVNQQEKR